MTVLIMKEAQLRLCLQSEAVNKCVIWDAAAEIPFQTQFSLKTMWLISFITQWTKK